MFICSLTPWVSMDPEHVGKVSSFIFVCVCVCSPAISLGFTTFWVRFLRMWPFFNPTIKVVTFRLRGWCVLGVFFVAGIHPSRTWTSGSFGSVRWNACVHRLDLGEFEPMLTPREKSPLPENFPEDWTRNAVDSEPKHYQRAIPAPLVHLLIGSLVSLDQRPREL